jgi:hypothetical protein
MTLRASGRDKATYSLGSPRLFREELEQIAGILAEEFTDLMIDFGGVRSHTGDSPADFAAYAIEPSAPQRLPHLRMTGRRGSARAEVEFTPYRASVTVTSPDNGARGAAQQIIDICAKRGNMRRSPFRYIAIGRPSAGTGALAALASAVMTMLIAAALPYSGAKQLVWVVGSGIGAALFMGLVWLVSSHREPVIVNVPRSEWPSHWARHRKVYIMVGLPLLGSAVVAYFVPQIPQAW